MDITVACNFIDLEHFEKDLEEIRDAGFDGIDFSGFNRLCPNLGSDEDYFTCELSKDIDVLRKRLAPFFAKCRKSGISIGQAHGPWPCYFQGRSVINEFLIEAVKKCIIICGEEKIPYLVIHPYTAELDDATRGEEINFNMYSRWIETAKQYGVKILIENLFYYYGTGNGMAQRLYDEPFANGDFAVKFIDSLNAEAGEEIFGFCLDTGHANLLSKNIYTFIKTLDFRLKALHLHDNDGVGDQHRIPYMPADIWGSNNIINWDSVLAGLAETKYNGNINFEVNYESVPRAVRSGALRFTQNIGEYFKKEIEKRRQ